MTNWAEPKIPWAPELAQLEGSGARGTWTGRGGVWVAGGASAAAPLPLHSPAQASGFRHLPLRAGLAGTDSPAAMRAALA